MAKNEAKDKVFLSKDLWHFPVSDSYIQKLGLEPKENYLSWAGNTFKEVFAFFVAERELKPFSWVLLTTTRIPCEIFMEEEIPWYCDLLKKNSHVIFIVDEFNENRIIKRYRINLREYFRKIQKYNEDMLRRLWRFH